MSRSEDTRTGGGISIQTLLISSVSAVVATVIVSQFWEQGTLFFTAMVPIAVALVTEAIKKPAEKITQVAPLVTAPRPRRGERRPPEETRRALPPDDPFGLYGSGPSKAPLRENRRLRVGLVTGLVAFVIGAVFVTASELTLGGSVGSSSGGTTLLGGSSERDRERDRDRPARDATPAPADDGGDAATPAPEPTATPEATATPAPTTTPAPTATPPPAATPTPAP